MTKDTLTKLEDKMDSAARAFRESLDIDELVANKNYDIYINACIEFQQALEEYSA